MAWGIEGDLGGIEQTLDRLYNAAEKATAKGLYKGAGIVADNLNASVNSIHTEVFEYATDGYKRPPSPEEKAVLQSSAHGIAKFHSNGIEMDTSVGFDNAGYATFGKGKVFGKMKYGRHKGERGIPIPMLARAINSGTSFREKQPFLNRAWSKSKSAADEAIRTTVDAELQKAADE